MSEIFCAVDRLEGSIAVLVRDDETTFEVPRNQLPSRVREGSILRVVLGPGGVPDWSTAKIDDKERERRLKSAEEQLKRMSESDPGGDISL
jgi:hypothetical protein